MILSHIASYLATMVDWSPHLNGASAASSCSVPPTENKPPSFQLYQGIISGVKVLRLLIIRETQDTIDLSNLDSITVAKAPYKTIRGRTLIAYFADEIAF